jgi:hypothetical protein
VPTVNWLPSFSATLRFDLPARISRKLSGTDAAVCIVVSPALYRSIRVSVTSESMSAGARCGVGATDRNAVYD